MAKSNGNLRLLITIIIVVAGIATSWGVMKATVDSTQKDVDTLTVEISDKVDKEDFEKVQVQVQETHDSSIRLETEMIAVNKTLEKILDKLDEPR